MSVAKRMLSMKLTFTFSNVDIFTEHINEGDMTKYQCIQEYILAKVFILHI